MHIFIRKSRNDSLNKCFKFILTYNWNAGHGVVVKLMTPVSRGTHVLGIHNRTPVSGISDDNGASRRVEGC